MKRTLMRTVAVLVVGGMVLAGCGRAARSSSGTAPTTAPASAPATVVVTPAPGSTTGGAGSVDNQLNDVNGLLSQIDGQVSADNQTPGDSD